MMASRALESAAGANRVSVIDTVLGRELADGATVVGSLFLRVLWVDEEFAVTI